MSKVDARCFNLSQRVDDFLNLGNANRTDLTPSDFWKEIVQSEEAVSRYVILHARISPPPPLAIAAVWMECSARSFLVKKAREWANCDWFVLV